MRNHFLLDVLEWAKKRSGGFSYSELISSRGFEEWEIKLLESYLKVAHENEGRSRDFRSPLLSETIFFVAKPGSGDFKDDTNLYTLTTDALFKYIDYEELKLARENAKQARSISEKSIGISERSMIVAMLAVGVSVIVPLLVTSLVTQNVKIDEAQLKSVESKIRASNPEASTTQQQIP